MYIERATSRKSFASRCEGCLVSMVEERVVGVPKFHSWGKCAMPLTNINSDWMSNASSGLCIILHYITRVLYFASWGVMTVLHLSEDTVQREIFEGSNFRGFRG